MKKSRAAGGPKGQQGGKKSFLNIVADIFVLLILVGQMLVYDDFYFNILQTKYKYYCVCALGMIGLFLLYGLVKLEPFKLARWNKIWPPRIKKWLKGKRFRDIFNSTDVMMVLFITVALISTALSPFMYEAFWGNKGRYVGGFFLLLNTVVYFCVSKCYKVKGWHIQMFLLSGMAVCLFGISDYFAMDLLHFKVNMDPGQYDSFTSFIGNINTFTACVALVMAMSGVLFASCTHIAELVWYGICVVISFFAIITGQSDNAYLALMAFFGFLPLYLFRSRKGFLRYFLLIALFLSTMQGVAWTQEQYPEAIRLAGLFRTLTGFEDLEKIVRYVWLLVIVLYALDLAVRKLGPQIRAGLVKAASQPAVGAAENALQPAAGTTKKGSKQQTTGAPQSAASTAQKGSAGRLVSADTAAQKRKPAWFARAWWLVIAAMVIVIAYAVYDATIAGNAERYGVLQQYVQFQDSWGTHRGYIWRIGVEDYKTFDPLQKIFGYGPDTFGIVTGINNYEEAVALYNERFDSTHNELLQIFITIGPLGLITYLGILVTFAWNAVKRNLENPYIMGAVFAVACYTVQSVVNISQPIATPVMWLLLCIAMAQPAVREKTLWKKS